MSISTRLTDTLQGIGDALALRAGARQWTGAELDLQTRRIAAGLAAQGVRAEDIVELHLDDHAEAIVLMLGVLRAGAAFCVIPTTYPQARIESIRRRTRPVAVCTGLSGALGALAAAPDPPPADALPERGPDDLAYVIFTSGSTGDPKAVEITDRGLTYLADHPGIYPGRVIGHLAALQFDACIYEILGGLLNGLSISCIDLDELLDRHTASSALAGVDTLFVTTQIFNLLVERSPQVLDDLELVIFGGERVSARHVRQALGRCRVVHAYGPTETTVYATVHEVSEVPEGADVPIGRPLQGACTHVLDEGDTPVGAGVTGELVIGGAGLMRGYRDQPEATAAAFVTVHGAAHYRSGDLVTADADGVLTYVGRRDRQVKVKGFRIDLTEIERVALDVPGPVRLHRALATAHDGRLRLFVTGCTDVAALRAHLRAQLPAFMVPVVTAVGYLPLTPNGKTDLGALVEQAKATTPAQERAREVFAALVPADEHDAQVTFVELGGDSLSAMDAVWRLDERGVRVDMALLLTSPLEAVLRAVA